MAKYVVCRDKEEAMAALRAGALYLNWGGGDWDWDICREPVRELDTWYGRAEWPPEHFAIRVEDEEDT